MNHLDTILKIIGGACTGYTIYNVQDKLIKRHYRRKKEREAAKRRERQIREWNRLG